MSDSAASAWRELERELDAWAGAGRRAEIWWRDDDADAPSPALERLLGIAETCRVPLALAVIPLHAEAGLADLIAADGAETAVFQHGYAHANHAPAAAKKCELVDPAARPAILDELARGFDRLAGLFAGRFRPVLVPPWNRIAPPLAARLPALGFTGLSAYKARPMSPPAAGLRQVNCHVDILQWRPQRQFLGTRAAIELLVGHLSAKRQGRADPGEASGILSHHQAHDAAAWDFLATLLQRLTAHPAVRLLPADEVFAGAPGQVQRERLS